MEEDYYLLRVRVSVVLLADDELSLRFEETGRKGTDLRSVITKPRCTQTICK